MTSPIVFCRPNIYITTPASAAKTHAPMAIPTIGPVPSPDLCETTSGGDVEVGGEVGSTPFEIVVRGEAVSAGKTFSPGLNSCVAFWANSNWLLKLNVEFFITLAVPSLWNLALPD